MITLITAVPGSGKTLYAVGIIQAYLDEGRPVYHNIEGLQPDAYKNNHLLFPAPADWTTTPDGSVVIYDECQQDHLYPATAQKGKIDDKRLTAMETHRHTGHDLFFITQAPTFVHHHVRKLVGSHIHFYRGGGATNVAKYTWSHTCDNPNDRREQERADFSIFRFDKSDYPKYKSSTVHTHKFRLPNKLIFIGLLIFAILAGVAYSLSKSTILGNLLFNNSDDETPAKVAPLAASFVPPPEPPTSPRAWLTDAPLTRPIGGCVASARACQCYTQKLEPLDLPDAQCRILIKSPLPAVVSVGQSSS